MRLTYRIKARPGEIGRVVELIRDRLAQTGVESEDGLFKIELCVRELLANAVEHGCRGDERLEIEILLEISQSLVRMTVVDPGPGFDWQETDLDRMPGLTEKGRGLPLARSISERLLFNQRGNRVTAWIRL